jgi:hypothetical protein
MECSLRVFDLVPKLTVHRHQYPVEAMNSVVSFYRSGGDWIADSLVVHMPHPSNLSAVP